MEKKTKLILSGTAFVVGGVIYYLNRHDTITPERIKFNDTLSLKGAGAVLSIGGLLYGLSILLKKQ